jgi:hypothetical protein
MRPVAGGRVMLVVQPSGGRPASRYSVLSGSLAGRSAGGGTRTGDPRELAGIPGACRGCTFFRSRAMAAWAARTCITGLDRLPVGIPVPARQPRNRKPEDRPVLSWLTGGTERHGTTDGPPFSTSREGDEACTTLLSCARPARGIPPLLRGVNPTPRSPAPADPATGTRISRRPTVPPPARASGEPPIGQDSRPSG